MKVIFHLIYKVKTINESNFHLLNEKKIVCAYKKLC
jgi:alanine dehydrogenase